MSVLFTAPPESLYDALFLNSAPRIIAAVGGGGKTTFLRTLAEELAARNHRVVITTTTKMYPPEDRDFWGTTAGETLALLNRHTIVWTGQPVSDCKMSGLPDPLPLLRTAADYILIEADGSRRRPLKMTDPAYEPCIPPEADAVVALAGLDALGKPIRDAVHRPSMAASMLGKPETAPVTEDDIARLLSHCYAPRHVLLNKADTPALKAAGKHIAGALPEAHCLVASLRDWGHAESR